MWCKRCFLCAINGAIGHYKIRIYHLTLDINGVQSLRHAEIYVDMNYLLKNYKTRLRQSMSEK